MTSATILRDCLSTAARVRSVAAAEASRKISVAQMVRVCTASDLQVWEHISVVNGKHRLAGFSNVLAALCINIRVFLLIEVASAAGNF